MPPANDALIFKPGRWYRIHASDGSIVNGRCTYTAPDRVIVTSPAGQYTTWTGEVARVDNLGPGGS